MRNAGERAREGGRQRERECFSAAKRLIDLTDIDNWGIY
jgi:hypothetical protein